MEERGPCVIASVEVSEHPHLYVDTAGFIGKHNYPQTYIHSLPQCLKSLFSEAIT